MSEQKKLWREIPAYVFVALARRGMEKLSLDQCFLPGCDNKDRKLLSPLEKDEFDEDDKHVKIITMKCQKCNGIFKFRLEELNRVAKPTKSKATRKSSDTDEDEKVLKMGLAYALDEKDKNLGHIGYF
ncbi:MAG: hypothetical protein EU547_05130 [Promethearchaeota archaeon]|nr:MAG: hypothetical protein EU547_05130 [Candidatus Lokiarchaeota archaeon]